MVIQRLIVVLAAFYLCAGTGAIASNFDNPFEKNVRVEVGKDSAWVIQDGAATRSGADAGNYYHLFYDRKQLRLRITESNEDSDAAARNYSQFTIEDIHVDGTRLPVFQWCLNNQEKHSRFLQQGLSVNNDICINRGQAGTFYMQLNVDTVKLLEQGRTLTYTIKPFRTSIDVNFDISDFAEMAAQLVAPAANKTVQQKPAPGAVVKIVKKCKALPPAGIVEVQPIEYECDDAVAKSMAESSIGALVKKDRERKEKAAAERVQKRLAAESARKKELEAQKAADAARIAEQAAIAASLAKQEAINNEIASKMLAVCKKKWEAGEHRCYCEKYIEHAPAGIKSDPSCGG